jgi:hypothetical protein
LIDWENIGFDHKNLTFYEKYIKKPDWWWDHFVGPRLPHGGKRKGAGRPSDKKPQIPKQGLTVVLRMNNIQRMSLEEMGEGDLSRGIEALINQHL